MSESRPCHPELLDRDQDARHAYAAAVESDRSPSSSPGWAPRRGGGTPLFSPSDWFPLGPPHCDIGGFQ
jgi:hypothetical protein